MSVAAPLLVPPVTRGESAGLGAGTARRCPGPAGDSCPSLCPSVRPSVRPSVSPPATEAAAGQAPAVPEADQPEPGAGASAGPGAAAGREERVSGGRSWAGQGRAGRGAGGLGGGRGFSFQALYLKPREPFKAGVKSGP